MNTCLPCDLEQTDAASRVYRDDDWSLDVAAPYDAPGWFILRLRRHAEGWEGLSPDETAGFGAISQRVVAAIREATGAPTVYFLSFGENYSHFHFLVIAREPDLAPEHRGAGILALREERRDPIASLAVAADVRAAFH